jgi:hypothetical protein
MSIELIKEKQRQFLAAKQAAEKAAEETASAAKKAFIRTGIPAMWAAIQDIQVPDWRGNASRETENTTKVPLRDHLKQLTDTSLSLKDWDGETKIVWKVETTEKGALWFTRRGRKGSTPETWPTGLTLQHDFAEYMAKLLPPFEDK